MPEELDPAKYHVMNSQQKKLFSLFIIVSAFIVLPVISYLYYKAAINRPSQPGKEVTIEIAGGQGLSQISSDLYNAGVLNSRELFKIYLISNQLDKKIEAGVYKIPAGSSVVQLATILQHGTNDTPVTFIEGWRTEQIALEANKMLRNVDYESFVQLARNQEGYLFPDTYSLKSDIREKELIQTMTENFNEKTKDILTSDNLQKVGMSKDQAVILASIVEREVSTDEDRKIVAGILTKRWKNGDLVGADATTQYAVAQARFGCDTTSDSICPTDDRAETIDWWPKTLTSEDLAYESPYNTRKVVGLPPAPISNPGLGAIEAVINPTVTDYNYYLTDSKGVTHYAKTLEEHNRNAALYL